MGNDNKNRLIAISKQRREPSKNLSTRLTKTELELIQPFIDKYSNGVTSDFIRLCIDEFIQKNS